MTTAADTGKTMAEDNTRIKTTAEGRHRRTRDIRNRTSTARDPGPEEADRCREDEEDQDRCSEVHHQTADVADRTLEAAADHQVRGEDRR